MCPLWQVTYLTDLSLFLSRKGFQQRCMPLCYVPGMPRWTQQVLACSAGVAEGDEPSQGSLRCITLVGWAEEHGEGDVGSLYRALEGCHQGPFLSRVPRGM